MDEKYELLRKSWTAKTPRPPRGHTCLFLASWRFNRFFYFFFGLGPCSRAWISRLPASRPWRERA